MVPCMHLTRCHEQKSKTLDDFYRDLGLSEDPVTGEIGRTMLSLIARLHILADERQVWGLTSHCRLYFLSADSSHSDWLVSVIASDSKSYFIEYQMPQDIAPWQRAYVKGEARSEDEAVQMILIAMEKSEGWSLKTPRDRA